MSKLTEMNKKIVAGGFMKAKKAVEGMFAKEETAEAVEEAVETTEE